MANIIDKRYITSADGGGVAAALADLATTLTGLWEWSDIQTSGTQTKFFVDAAKTYGILIKEASTFSNGALTISLFKGGSEYSTACTDGNMRYTILKFEKTATALIISGTWKSGSYLELTAQNCQKYIICGGINNISGDTETLAIYLGSQATSNTSLILSSDTDTPVSIAAQDADANTNAKTTNLIPFYNPSSACVTTDVYQSICENISSWYFGDVIVNANPYRMSGSVFALDR